MGTAWYSLVEGFTLLDAAFMAVTTVTTVGYREVQPLDVSGRLFTIVFIFVGVGIVSYTVVAVAEAVLAGEIAEAMGLRRQNRKVRRMEQRLRRVRLRSCGSGSGARTGLAPCPVCHR